VGPLLAIAFMVLLSGDVRAVLWIAVVPAFVSVAILLFGVHETTHDRHTAARAPIRIADARNMGSRYWRVVLLGAVFTLARFSEAFLVLRAESVGVSMSYVPLVMVVMSVAYAVTAYPAGAASDRMSRRKLLLTGLAVLVAADIILARADTFATVLVGASFWGVHMGLTQGLLSKLVADTAPVALRGTGFGLFNMVCGAALLVASVVAGALWQNLGPGATFLAGACFAAIAAAGLAASLAARGTQRKPD
jgi:predicted MFS family arabinose efflux permease